MSIYIFVGPTLSLEKAKKELDAIYLPPVSQGDVYRVTEKQPKAIGIIDGYFERVPSVWHKEILWAMNQGIHVFGSASMGALRAAELFTFGMEGVGQIFEDFKNNILEDDDEVAILHGPKETQYNPLSEAMVNIRHTFLAAKDAHIISKSTYLSLIELGKSIYYPDRTYSRILDQAKCEGLPKYEITSLHDWLKKGQINQKEIDAISMLKIMKDKLNNNYTRKTVKYTFEYTDMWNASCDTAGTLSVSSEMKGDMIFLEQFLDEIRLEGNNFSQIMNELTLRLLKIEDFKRYGLTISSDALKDSTEKFRQERNLLEPTDLLKYQLDNNMDDEDFIQLMEEEGKLRLMDSFKPELLKHLPNYLRVIGKYEKILKKIIDKQHMLESNFMTRDDLLNIGITDDDLIKWYFEKYLKIPFVENIEKYIKNIGFENKYEFLRALKREYYYLQRIEE